MARDRPSPYVKERRFFTVARGPVPRECWIARGMARDRPSPYDEGTAFFSPQRGDRPRDIKRFMKPAQLNPFGLKNKNLTFFVKCGKINYGFVR